MSAVGTVLVVLTAAIGLVSGGVHPTSAAAPAIPAGPVATAGPGAANLPGWHLTALGDSVTSGSHCNCTAFPALYADELAGRYRRPVTAVNEGVGGSTSDDLRAALTPAHGEVPDTVAGSDLVVITIGANDFGEQHDDVEAANCGTVDPLQCARPGLGHLADTMTAILTRIKQLRAGRPTAVLVTGYWNVFEDGDEAVKSYPLAGQATSRALTMGVNQVLQGVAGQQGATYVDLYTPFLGADGSSDPTGLLADDGDHPSAPGHQVIADALLAAGISPLELSDR